MEKMNAEKLVAAVKHAGVQYWEYDFLKDSAYVGEYARKIYHLDASLEHFPQSFVERGYVEESQVRFYLQMHEAIKRGTREIVREFQIREAGKDEYDWIRIHYTTIFDEKKRPRKAIATAENINSFKETQQQFFLAARQLQAAVWIYDLKTCEVSHVLNSEKVFGGAW